MPQSQEAPFLTSATVVGTDCCNFQILQASNKDIQADYKVMLSKSLSIVSIFSAVLICDFHECNEL